MNRRASIDGVENIMTAYENMRGDSPFYSLWYSGREKSFQWNNAQDVEGGIDRLRATLQMIADSNDDSLYYLRIHSEYQKSYKNNADHVICTIPCRMSEPDDQVQTTASGLTVMPQRGNAMPYEMWEMLSLSKQVPELLQQNKQLLEKITELESEREGVDDSTMGKITGILNHPMAQTVLGAIMAKLMPGGGMRPSPVMSGIPTQQQMETDTEMTPEELKYWETVDKALNRLQEHCDLSVYMPKLADYADKNPKMFEMLLGNL